jgi:hypothetical protein
LSGANENCNSAFKKTQQIGTTAVLRFALMRLGRPLDLLEGGRHALFQL